MYPDWPESPADLVPLPLCDGPKLKPFDFQGPQNIKFIEHLGSGGHSHVFKIEILDKIYSLKVFRFMETFYGPQDLYGQGNLAALTLFANYSEPFDCECGAFGRLQETNNEKLATRFLGYVFLDEENEAAMMDKFNHIRLSFSGCDVFPRGEREAFPGRKLASGSLSKNGW